MSVCPQCHSPLKPDSRFCGKCGAKVNQDASPAKPISTPTHNPIPATPNLNPSPQSQPQGISSRSETAQVQPVAPPLSIELVACPACQQKVSSQAVACPHCGQPLTNLKHQLPSSSTLGASLQNQPGVSLSPPKSTTDLKASEKQGAIIGVIVAVLLAVGLDAIGYDALGMGGSFLGAVAGLTIGAVLGVAIARSKA